MYSVFQPLGAAAQPQGKIKSPLLFTGTGICVFMKLCCGSENQAMTDFALYRAAGREPS